MVSALNDERAILNTSDEGQGLHCILISKILAYLLWVGWWCDTCIVRISTIIWLAGSSVIIHFIVFKYGHTLFDCMVENILKERDQHPLHISCVNLPWSVVCPRGWCDSHWAVWIPQFEESMTPGSPVTRSPLQPWYSCGCYGPRNI